MVSDMEAMYDTLLSIGFGSGEMKTVSKPDGTHSEWFWEREFPDAYRWLFAMDTTTAIGAGYQTSEPFMYYTDGLIYFNEIFDNDSARLILYDLLGRPLFHIGISDVGRTKLPPLPDGIYIALVENETSRFVQKIVIGK